MPAAIVTRRGCRKRSAHLRSGRQGPRWATGTDFPDDVLSLKYRVIEDDAESSDAPEGIDALQSPAD